ncbi:MAG TPA: ribosome biogenesis/translation initiation ATPase RLI [Nitrososphaerales archaeon]|nr:ribosome biogenesis/translation initiation ATPase RLI [Nitrososphaerales archaeon]
MVHRIAGLDDNLCHSDKCGLECIKNCPVNINGDECIVLGEEKLAVISEQLCIGCGICIKVCPFEAITILNLSEELQEEKIHQYGVNTFRLYRLPTPRKGQVVGLVGRNGTGKSTALQILAGQLVPNLGDYEHEATWNLLLKYLSGKELKEHFEKVARGEVRISLKPQAVYRLPEVWKKDVFSLLTKMDEIGGMSEVVDALGLDEALQKNVAELSGGELQRVAIAVAALKDADMYLFDEPSSFNDVYQRLAVSKLIRSIAGRGKYVVLVEHDITFLDYASDYVQILYGEPGVYGIVSSLYPSRSGINALLDGFLPNENTRFRDKSVTFEITTSVETQQSEAVVAKYGSLRKSFPGFELDVSSGEMTAGTIFGVIGANALGKTTYLKMLAGEDKPDSGEVNLGVKIALKPQYLRADYPGTVQEFINEKVGKGFDDTNLQTYLAAPLRVEKLFARNVSDLSGGELQKLAIVSTFAAEADLYALDEPSAFVDVEDRFVVAKAMGRLVKARGKTAVIIDHDIQLLDLISDRMIVFTGEPGRKGVGTSPLGKEDGMNTFLSEIGLTYRRDVKSGRPRVNKPDSKRDREQKEKGQYYYAARAGQPEGEEEQEEQEA